MSMGVPTAAYRHFCRWSFIARWPWSYGKTMLVKPGKMARICGDAPAYGRRVARIGMRLCYRTA